MRHVALAGLIAVCAVVGSAEPLHSQSVRATGITSLQLVQLRPLAIDSVPVADAPGDGLIRRTADGRLVRCVAGDPFCRFTRSADRETIAPLIQDVNVSAWGFGRGIRVYAQLRTRTSFGGPDDLWPRADDRFDALSAWVEYDRDRLRLRGGRQWKTSGLGYYNFDGLSVLYRPLPGLSVEGFGGWSLARNLNEPRTSDAIAAIETFAPDDRALIFGLQARYRPAFSFSAGALYQREIRSDRLGLYSERAALDGAWRYGRGSVTGSLEADVASAEINDARLRVSYDVTPDLTFTAFGRIYEPFFELWTIWGAFDPVGFREAGGGGTWRTRGATPVQIGLDFARRAYAATNASTVFGDYRTDGWSVGADASVHATTAWLIQGAYRIDLGFGAARSEATLRLQREISPAAQIGASVIGFERQFEFRVAEGTVYGIGVDGLLRISDRSRISGGLSTYRHYGNDGAPDVDWSQFRGSVRFEWTLGPEPGMERLAGGSR